jgi:hypothetical protein
MNLGDKQEKTVSSAVPDATLGTSRIGNLVPEKEDNSPNIELLGGIYRLVLRSIEHEMREDEEEHQRIKDSEKDEDGRNKEIIKALTGRTKKSFKREIAGTKPETAPQTNFTLSKPPTVPAATTTPVTTGAGAAVGAAATAVAVGAGTILGSLSLELKAKISGRESAGMTEKSYNIMNIAPGEKSNSYEVVKGNKDIDGNPYEKNLTDMNIGEVIQLAETRGKKFNKRGAGKAAGKYQFMPGTLADMAKLTFGTNWQSVQYSPENQEKLMDTFTMSNVEKLQKAGLPVSDASLYIMHFTGSTKKTAMILDDNNNDMKMSNVLGEAGTKANPRIAEMTVGQYKQSLKTEVVKKGQIVKPSFNFEPLNIKTGDVINESSKRNYAAKEELKKKSTGTVTNNTTINESQSSGNSESNVSPDDRPIILKKAD